jgi:hypothetical protein
MTDERLKWMSNLTDGEMFAHTHAEVVKMFRECVDEIERMRWIPCDESLPEPGKEVLVRSRENPGLTFWSYSSDYIDAECGGWSGVNEGWMSKVDEWMPIPE